MQADHETMTSEFLVSSWTVLKGRYRHRCCPSHPVNRALRGMELSLGTEFELSPEVIGPQSLTPGCHWLPKAL